MSYNHNTIINKLDKLRELVIFKIADYKKHSDYIWCVRLLDDVQNGGLVPDKTEFKMANLMWKKHTSGVSKDDDVMWSLVDMLLTQDNPTKIGAIKIYRKFVDSTLKEAKEAVDAREYGLKNGWDI